MSNPAGDFEDPWDRVSRLLPVALGADVPRDRRLQAISALADMDESALRLLALDSEWRGVLGLLASTENPDSATASSPKQAGGAAPGLSASRYAKELRRLVNDDFETPRVMVAAVPAGAPTLEERLRAAARSAPLDPRAVAPVDYARRSAWSSTVAASGFVVVDDLWPGMAEPREAFLDEVIRGAGRLAIPPRLGAFVSVVLERMSHHREWVIRLLGDIEDIAAGVADGPDCIDALAALHQEARLHVAHALRSGEVLDREVVAVLDLYANVAITRAAGARDVARALGSAGSLRDAARDFRRGAASADLLWERALQAVMRTTHDEWRRRLGPRDTEALGFAAVVRRRPPGPERELLLLDTWTAQDGRL